MEFSSLFDSLTGAWGDQILVWVWRPWPVASA